MIIYVELQILYSDIVWIFFTVHADGIFKPLNYNKLNITKFLNQPLFCQNAYKYQFLTFFYIPWPAFHVSAVSSP